MEPDEQSKAKDEVYRLIGRNMILFQQVEHGLKILLNNARFVGTASDIKKLQELGPKPDKRMLGVLIKPLVENHLTPLDIPPPPVVEGEVSFSFKMTFEHSPEERAAFQEQLESLVAERNEFVHHLLSKLQLSSLEGCQRAIEDLERQRERIIPVRDKLRNWIEMMVKERADLAQYILQNLHEIWQKIEAHRANNPQP